MATMDCAYAYLLSLRVAAERRRNQLHRASQLGDELQPIRKDDCSETRGPLAGLQNMLQFFDV